MLLHWFACLLWHVGVKLEEAGKLSWLTLSRDAAPAPWYVRRGSHAMWDPSSHLSHSHLSEWRDLRPAMAHVVPALSTPSGHGSRSARTLHAIRAPLSSRV